MQNKYEEYAVLDAQIRQLTHQKEVLRDQILSGLEEQKLDKVETSVGKFTVTTLKTWTYTEKVTEMNEDLKRTIEKHLQDGHMVVGMSAGDLDEWLRQNLG